MTALYYLGGPRDLTKEALCREPERTIHVHEVVHETMRRTWMHRESICHAEFVRHIYRVRQVSNDVWIAVYEGAA